VLTLSATPIPRTLHMALSGMRDMSVITRRPPTAPDQDAGHPLRADQIEEAILRELNRGGQVYFIHNRVHNIEEVASACKEIVPGARITIGHGQMNEDELEETMLKFIDREFDILVATTIVENGLDIPNCNTIIINRADAFGLAQLYQLRGRVGRGNRRVRLPDRARGPGDHRGGGQAPGGHRGIHGAGRRLSDRHARHGNPRHGQHPGREQHGAMEAIGFELYCEMLDKEATFVQGDAILVTVNAWNRGSRVNKAVKLFKAYINSIDAALGKKREPASAGRR
jgi:transcription-repair coupling factor (superfamily II helicase)